MGDATIPVRMVNPFVHPLRIFGTGNLADFDRVGNDFATFEIGKYIPVPT